MRWVLVSHLLPPRHRGGVEVHTLRLGRVLADRGHEVWLVAADDDPRVRPGRVRRRELAGLPVLEIGHGRRAFTPSQTLGLPAVEEAAARVIGELRPAVVHFQHLMHVGLGLPARLKTSGRALFLTLHEYWLLCARGGQLRDHRDRLCEGPALDRCQSCLQDHRFGRGPRELRIAAAAERMRSLTGCDVYRMLKGLRQRLPARSTPSTAVAEEVSLTDFLEEREIRVERALATFDAVFAPSRHLADRFAALRPGWPKVEVSPNGVPRPAVAASAPPEPAGDVPLHVAYLGSVVPQKGLHVLLEAVRGLERMEVHVHGDAGFDPSYRRRLGALAGPSVIWHGPYDPFEAGRVLAPAHVLVTPSLWPENAPLVLSEARSMRVPALASALGGMPELVEEGRDGHLFAAGDVAALRARLLELRDDPGHRAALRASLAPPRWIDEEAAFLEQRASQP